MFVFFFFKQKTAYEMRISDWSSDVCSSDLHRKDLFEEIILEPTQLLGLQQVRFQDMDSGHAEFDAERLPAGLLLDHHLAGCFVDHHQLLGRVQAVLADLLDRSEEHTSELQSLMRISYAVLCLKHKKHTHIILHT